MLTRPYGPHQGVLRSDLGASPFIGVGVHARHRTNPRHDHRRRLITPARDIVIPISGGRVEAPITARTETAAATLANRVRLVSDTYSVDRAETTGEYLVVRRTLRERYSERALYSGQGEAWLYGKFDRRDHAYRWAAALQRATDPRNTRKLICDRQKEMATLNA